MNWLPQDMRFDFFDQVGKAVEKQLCLRPIQALGFAMLNPLADGLDEERGSREQRRASGPELP